MIDIPLGSLSNIYLELSDQFPDMGSSVMTLPNSSAVEEDLLSPTNGAQNFSSEAAALSLVPNVPFEITNGALQGNSSSSPVLVTTPENLSQVGTS